MARVWQAVALAAGQPRVLVTARILIGLAIAMGTASLGGGAVFADNDWGG